MNQLTLDDGIRQAHIDRLDRSMARWRETGLDLRLPDEYARYCGTLDHLRARGDVVVTTFRPEDLFRDGAHDRAAVPLWVNDLVYGFARACIGAARESGPRLRREREPK